jgi:hypothetical protein
MYAVSLMYAGLDLCGGLDAGDMAKRDTLERVSQN